MQFSLETKVRKQLRFRLVMMSAILGTLFILGGRAKLLFVVLSFCMSPPISRWNEPRHGSTHIPRLHQAPCTRPGSQSSSPGEAPSPDSAPGTAALLYTHFLTKRLRRTKTGSSPRKGSTRPSHGPPSRARAPRCPGAHLRPRSSPGAPAGPFPEPRPSDLAVHGNGVRRDDERLPRRSWTRPSWPPSGPEPS